MNIVIAIIAVVVVLAVIAAVAMVLTRRKQQRVLEQRRGHADELRHQAAGQTHDVRTTEQRAAETEAEAKVARERAERAEREASVAQQEAAVERARQEDVVREADQVDPRVDNRADDYRPTTDPQALKDPLAPTDPQATDPGAGRV